VAAELDSSVCHGNGRTSRAVSYLVLCIRLGTLLPGKLTIPEQIERDRGPYYKALEAADDAWVNDVIDLKVIRTQHKPSRESDHRLPLCH
jgi:Fic family protein